MFKHSYITIFQNYGKKFIKELSDTIRNQKDLAGNAFIPSKGSIKGKKVVNDNGNHPRLKVTGKLEKKGFRYRATDDSLTLYVPEDTHHNGVKYSDIVFWNNKPTSDNSNSPLIFPTVEAHVSSLTTYQQLDKDLDTEFQMYMKSVTGTDINRTISV